MYVCIHIMVTWDTRREGIKADQIRMRFTQSTLFHLVAYYIYSSKLITKLMPSFCYSVYLFVKYIRLN